MQEIYHVGEVANEERLTFDVSDVPDAFRKGIDGLGDGDLAIPRLAQYILLIFLLREQGCTWTSPVSSCRSFPLWVLDYSAIAVGADNISHQRFHSAFC